MTIHIKDTREIMNCQNNPDCRDKDSTHYFMCHMTQEDWDKRRDLSDIKKAHEFLYHFNKIKMKQIENIENS